MMASMGYVVIGKDLPKRSDVRELSCWFFSNKVKDVLGDIPATIPTIYEEVTKQEGLTLEETAQLLRSCKMRGYFRGELM